MSSKIEQTIGEIEQYIDACGFQPLSGKKNIIVNREQIEVLLRELRMRTPEEIKKYQRIIENKDAILTAANEKADAILKDANIEKDELVSEQEIMKQAYAQAQEIVDAAQTQANALIEAANAQAQEIVNNAAAYASEMQTSAMQYVDDRLEYLQSLLQNTMNAYSSTYSAMMDALGTSFEKVSEDRKELAPDLYGEALLEEQLSDVGNFNIDEFNIENEE